MHLKLILTGAPPLESSPKGSSEHRRTWLCTNGAGCLLSVPCPPRSAGQRSQPRPSAWTVLASRARFEWRRFTGRNHHQKILIYRFVSREAWKRGGGAGGRARPGEPPAAAPPDPGSEPGSACGGERGRGAEPGRWEGRGGGKGGESRAAGMAPGGPRGCRVPRE